MDDAALQTEKLQPAAGKRRRQDDHYRRQAGQHTDISTTPAFQNEPGLCFGRQVNPHSRYSPRQSLPHADIGQASLSGASPTLTQIQHHPRLIPLALPILLLNFTRDRHIRQRRQTESVAAVSRGVVERLGVLRDALVPDDDCAGLVADAAALVWNTQRSVGWGTAHGMVWWNDEVSVRID